MSKYDYENLISIIADLLLEYNGSYKQEDIDNEKSCDLC